MLIQTKYGLLNMQPQSETHIALSLNGKYGEKNIICSGDLQKSGRGNSWQINNAQVRYVPGRSVNRGLVYDDILDQMKATATGWISTNPRILEQAGLMKRVSDTQRAFNEYLAAKQKHEVAMKELSDFKAKHQSIVA